jgi:hypothetical protein
LSSSCADNLYFTFYVTVFLGNPSMYEECTCVQAA